MWLGNAAANRVRAYIADKPISKGYLLEGTIIEMNRIARRAAQVGEAIRRQERSKRERERRKVDRAYDQIMGRPRE